jgi:hypothetical protein
MFFVKLFLVIGLGNHFTPYLYPNLKTCTWHPTAETWDLSRGRDGSPSRPATGVRRARRATPYPAARPTKDGRPYPRQPVDAGRTQGGARFIVHSATGIGGWRLAVGNTRDRRARRSHAPTSGRPAAAQLHLGQHVVLSLPSRQTLPRYSLFNTRYSKQQAPPAASACAGSRRRPGPGRRGRSRRSKARAPR